MPTATSRNVIRALRKIWRSTRIWGLRRTLYKVAGRTRRGRMLFGLLRKRTGAEPDLGIIGCGQYAFSTIGYAISTALGNRFALCYDINADAMSTFADFYPPARPAPDADEVIRDERTKTVYIASNHASHADYAVRALQLGKTVYVEKPISVTWDQFARLTGALRASSGSIYGGYNRPFSKAVRTLSTYGHYESQPLTLCCFVAGHVIPAGHWYRNPGEGTRICGNVGHWIDLAVHMLGWTGMPDRWSVGIAYGDKLARDDNLAITLTSERGDLVTIVLTSRTEPFDGINETINIQCADVTAKIDDFRTMDVWKAEEHFRFRYTPKDAGHDLAVLQPFSAIRRPWREVELSTCLMLFITDMIVEGSDRRDFSFDIEMARLDSNRFTTIRKTGS